MFALCLAQEETIKTGFCHESRQAGSVCKQENMFLGGKRHHTNQPHNYMANHVIWLLRNRGSCGRVGGRRLTAAVMDTEIEIVSFKS